MHCTASLLSSPKHVANELKVVLRLMKGITLDISPLNYLVLPQDNIATTTHYSLCNVKFTVNMYNKMCA